MPTPGYDCRPVWERVFERMNEENLQKEVAATVALSQGDDAEPFEPTAGVPDPASLGWRRLDGGVQDEFLRWAEDQLAQRLAIGEQEYQSHIYGFQGDPLQHGIAEQLDGLFYSWMQLRQREATPPGGVDDKVLLLLWDAYLETDVHRHGLGFAAWINRPLRPISVDTAIDLRRAWQDFYSTPDDSMSDLRTVSP